MDFVTKLSISTDWKDNSYNFILIIIGLLMKMGYYEPVKVIIDASGLAKVILEVVVWHYSLPNSIVSDRGLLFTSKFWSLLCYIFEIEQKLSTAFHPQIDG